MAELQAALAELPVPTLRLALGEWGFWLPGIAWLAPRQPCDALMALAVGLRDLLDEHGFRFDRKAFRPHITLIRRARRPAAWPAPAQLIWMVREFCLFASQPGPQGVQYRELARFA
ncbi:2'-5' RNA ligase [Chitinimonas taiwanensis DSM 18899]|uniref:2'-5' RNA ligase n=2 Tax=Chitinimonas TaxID=240411 RepID=A0A1K2HPK4_9NEIS|nr:2'-5' RNA ligase [Chitinimonas taiwanensis DSM 18899]